MKLFRYELELLLQFAGYGLNDASGMIPASQQASLEKLLKDIEQYLRAQSIPGKLQP